MIRSIIIRLFVPEKEYKYATYRSERHEEKPNIRKKGSGVVKCCNNCRYYGFARNEYGEEVLCCRLYGAPTSAYSSCDGFSE